VRELGCAVGEIEGQQLRAQFSSGHARD
jgi:hypothetical protein